MGLLDFDSKYFISNEITYVRNLVNSQAHDLGIWISNFVFLLSRLKLQYILNLEITEHIACMYVFSSQQYNI